MSTTPTLTPRTRTVYLLQGEDEERLNDLRETAAKLRAKANKIRKDTRPDEWTEADSVATAAEEAADQFAEEAQPRAVKVIMRSIGRKKWKALLKDHPPREGDESDKVARYNIDTAPEHTVPACLASPALPDAEREAFLDDLSDAQFDYLARVAHDLNRRVGADPTQRLLSASSQTSDETSSSPSAPE